MIIKAGIFDLDGVVTDTATIHFQAWKRMLDEYLRLHASQTGEPLQALSEQDYRHSIDGKPRIDGLQSFFKSRHMVVPIGSEDDAAEKSTIHGLAKRKQNVFLELLDRDTVPVFKSTLKFIHTLQQAHVKAVIATSSKNCNTILKKAGIETLFDAQVDGLTLEKLKLAGKPHADMLLEAAKCVQAAPSQCFIVDDAIAGIQAGKAGAFGLVIGIDRTATQQVLYRQNGADIVIHDMSDITLSDIIKHMPKAE